LGYWGGRNDEIDRAGTTALGPFSPAETIDVEDLGGGVLEAELVRGCDRLADVRGEAGVFPGE
jgi:hypothetical protein